MAKRLDGETWGSRLLGLGFRFRALGFNIQGLGLRLQDFRFWCLRLCVYGLGCRV